MGTFAKADGEVKFESAAAMSLVVEQIDDFIDKVNNGDFPKDNPNNGDYSLELEGEWEDSHSMFCFSAFSSREPNLQWQIERFTEFLKDLPGIVEINVNVMVQGDGFHWSKFISE